MAQMVKNLSAAQQTCVQLLGGEDPLQKGMAAHSRILAWRVPQAEEPGGLQGHEESDTTEATYHALTLRLQTLISSEHAI